MGYLLIVRPCAGLDGIMFRSVGAFRCHGWKAGLEYVFRDLLMVGLCQSGSLVIFYFGCLEDLEVSKNDGFGSGEVKFDGVWFPQIKFFRWVEGSKLLLEEKRCSENGRW